MTPEELIHAARHRKLVFAVYPVTSKEPVPLFEPGRIQEWKQITPVSRDANETLALVVFKGGDERWLKPEQLSLTPPDDPTLRAKFEAFTGQKAPG